MPNLYREFADLIENNRIEESFTKLRDLLTGDLSLELVSLKNRWSKNEGDNRKGIVTNSDYSVERNKIVSALLALLLEADQTPPASTAKKGPANSDPLPVPIDDSEDLEKIIGKSTFTRTEWITKMADASKSVCRIVVTLPSGKSWKGTGFLVEGGFVFTNHHILGKVEEARYALLEFNYVNEKSKISSYRLKADSWIGDPVLDFARVKVEDDPNNPLEQWGHLDTESGYQVQINDDVPIIQHPKGEVQQVSFRDNHIKRISDDGKYIFYTTDTDIGSSGSPVFNADWRVIGLHRSAMKEEDLNKGTLLTSIMDYLSAAGSSNKGQEEEPPTKDERMEATGPVRIFWMYDESAQEMADQLKVFFKIKERKGEIEIFDMHRVAAGDQISADVDETIDAELAASNLVMCLITPMFLATNIELAESARDQKKRIIPVLLSEVPLDDTFMKGLVTLPKRPPYVPLWPNRDAAFLHIYSEVSRTIELIKNA
ncbi:MAG: trypsin-like peptidase domain-containing protein [Saprospiraceae bacterium]